mgnify:CR=1 FL=1
MRKTHLGVCAPSYLILLTLVAFLASACGATAVQVIPTDPPTITPTFTPTASRTPGFAVIATARATFPMI